MRLPLTIVRGVLGILLVGCGDEPHTGKQTIPKSSDEASRPKTAEQMCALMVEMLGQNNVEREQRYIVVRILSQIRDRAVVPALVAGTRDERLFDERGNFPNDPPELGPRTMLVEDVCTDLLNAYWGIGRGTYVVDDWTTWWEERRSWSNEEIRRDIGSKK